MTTLHPRLNITLNQVEAKILTDLAEQEHTSSSKLARELILEALERREDMALSALAKIRDSGAKLATVSHEDAWK